MRQMIVAKCLLCWGLMAHCSSGLARLPPVNLDEIVASSDFIFVGTVHRRGTEPLLATGFSHLGRLELNVDRVICGVFAAEEWPEGRLQTLFDLNPIERPSFEQGTRYVFFARTDHNGVQLAPSFLGAAALDSEGMVGLRQVDDVGRSLPLDSLVERIDCERAIGKSVLFR
ncbi:hypothetical protein [Pseudomarimonas arenosa]|uniref:Uncharacterized protein n=1 Tax=Pseudomarimonas arenosa TaxID=2774145 RepID=A0AAW3ZUT5_9GAMM|nr:hypothetical protein [Pseudomarimonas arenosa]MBD8528194.1 hypothetical protein [Pseudomarimonas arenosa]